VSVYNGGMNPAPRVLHRTARPISVNEFVDALQATCPPRFPGARGSQPRPVALAVSGGVDSMALTYLSWRAHREHMRMRVADNPVDAFYGLTVDHRLREGSEREARAVTQFLQERFGMRTWQLGVHWREALEAAGVSHPKDLPNFETIARRLRYRCMALLCAQGHIASMFLAHHQDDQYETVLMRLMSGHGRAGLLGMRTATDIPECQDMHGAYQSGFVDDQLSTKPMINYRPTKEELKSIRAQIMADLDRDLAVREVLEPTKAGAFADDKFDAYMPRTNWTRRAAPLDVEDGGIMIYRPLLEFTKDRLVATCEANGVPWFEDATNRDRTLTLRNAVRHLWMNYTLPAALQKPAVLEMSNRLRKQAASDEAEVDRLLRRTVLKEFESTAGTVVVQLPSFRPPRLRRDQDYKVRRQKRLEHYRRIAILLVKRLIAMVTPEPLGSFSSSLPNTVARLFPSLNDNPSAYPQQPKAFNISGVHFTPVKSSSRSVKRPGAPLQWFLARQPYVSGQAVPQINYGCLRLRHRWRRLPDQWRWPAQHRSWKLWDGRFWVTISNRSPVHVAVAPFDIRHAKAFRDSLPDNRSRDELMAVLKIHAPGKVRYTLPAIYTAGDFAEAVGRDDNRVLVALPTLGIAQPGLHKWIRYDIRYRRVD
ncbi:adenine nucleotide alpha hydrolases-like protein, partial [Cryphonectria parasitica EP155]